jgi:ribosomal protein S17E
MRPTTIPLLLLPLLAGTLIAAEVAINIGDTPLVIPTPRGFVPVTKEMAALDQMLETFVAPQNTRFISYIPESQWPAVQRGELPDMPRTLSLQTNKKTVTRTTTTSDFEELKKIVRRQNEDMVKQVEKQIPGFLEQATRKLEGQFNRKLDMDINGMVPLPPHEESERSMAYSILLNLTVKGPDGQATNHPGVVTATFLHARGKLFFLYVNGAENDLEWSRDISRNWATAILAANPSDAATAKKESARSGGFDWSRVLRSALIGGLIGGAYALLRMFMRKGVNP